MRPVAAIATIGDVRLDVGRFLRALRAADVRVLIDVRQRRGVRGSEYAWANSARCRRPWVRPASNTAITRSWRRPPSCGKLQYREDAKSGAGKRSRTELAPEYRDRYTSEILSQVDLAAFVASLPSDGTTALLCVERDPEACHRSLIAERLAAKHGLSVTHLRP